MSTTNTPNMGLIVPGVGSEAGPDYAIEINNDLNIVDVHDHSPGSGVPITPSGLNINAELTFNNQSATSLASLTLVPQTITPVSISTLYNSGGDLFFIDGLGNNIPITSLGSVAGTPGSIANLVSPASASYVAISQKFVWQSGANTAADMDFGAAIMRNLSPNSTYSLTLQPPAALSNDYVITLPTQPTVTSFLTMDNAGNIFSSPALVGSLTTSNLSASAGILGSQIAATTITGSNIVNSTITGAKVANATLSDTQIIPGGITNASIGSVATTKITGNLAYVSSTVSASVQTPGTSYAVMTGFAGTTITGSQDARQYLVTVSCLTDPGYWSSTPTDLIYFRIQDAVGGNVRYYTFDTVGQNAFNFSYIATTTAGVSTITFQGYIKTATLGTTITIPSLAVTVKELL